MTTIVTRTSKGSALTHAEMDANFTNLNETDASIAAALAVHIDDTIDAHASSAIGYIPAGTGAVARDVQSKLRESVSVEDYTTHAAYVAASSDGGFFRDDATPGRETRVRDRMFVGDAAKYTGNRLGASGYGSSWLATAAASWIIKNSVLSASTEDGNAGIGILGASRTAPGVSPTYTNCGVAGLTLNEGENTFGRAFYAEAMHKATGASPGTVGYEVQVGNWSSITPVANAYSMAGSVVNGVYIGVESGTGYTIGDSNTPISTALNPAGAAIDIAGGSLLAAYQRWVTGIVFRNGALVRDGVTDIGVAISMAQKHQINWNISAANVGAFIRSEVTNTAQPVGIVFNDKTLNIVGASERKIVSCVDDVVGAGAVNYPVLNNSRTGIPVKFAAAGTDANVSVDIQSQGTGVVRLIGRGGTAESFRAQFNGAYVNFLTATGSVTAGAVATLGVGGSDTNIDLALTTKGTGVLRFGSWASNADAAINGYVTIKDSGGTTRKLATIA